MLKISLPKGSLEKQTFQLFKEADLEVLGTSRSYQPEIKDPRISEVKILRPQEIPKYVEEGYFDLGISGQDCVLESSADIVEVAELPYSKVTSQPVQMVIAVHEDTDIDKPEDIPPNSRISTEYPKLTKKYFNQLGIPVQIFYSHGATEAKVPNLMDVVVDLTETGETLRKNRLKIIGVMHKSYTKLIANKNAWDNPDKKKAIEEIKLLLLGVIEARGRVLISLNVSEKQLDKVVEFLPAMKKPTISKLYKSDYYEVSTVVDKDQVNILIPKLKSAGAEDILEFNITKIVS